MQGHRLMAIIKSGRRTKFWIIWTYYIILLRLTSTLQWSTELLCTLWPIVCARSVSAVQSWRTIATVRIGWAPHPCWPSGSICEIIDRSRFSSLLVETCNLLENLQETFNIHFSKSVRDSKINAMVLATLIRVYLDIWIGLPQISCSIGQLLREWCPLLIYLRMRQWTGC